MIVRSIGLLAREQVHTALTVDQVSAYVLPTRH